MTVSYGRRCSRSSSEPSSGGTCTPKISPAGAVTTRPWGERSFYVVDPWGNDLCFCENGTLYT